MGCPEVEDLEMVSSMDACVCVHARVCACVSVCVCVSSVNPQRNYSCQTANGQEKGALKGKH